MFMDIDKAWYDDESAGIKSLICLSGKDSDCRYLIIFDAYVRDVGRLQCAVVNSSTLDQHITGLLTYGKSGLGAAYQKY